MPSESNNFRLYKMTVKQVGQVAGRCLLAVNVAATSNASQEVKHLFHFCFNDKQVLCPTTLTQSPSLSLCRSLYCMSPRC